MLHACDQRFDVTGNLKNFCELNKAYIIYAVVKKNVDQVQAQHSAGRMAFANCSERCEKIMILKKKDTTVIGEAMKKQMMKSLYPRNQEHDHLIPTLALFGSTN